MNAANDDGELRPDLFAGLAQSHVEAARSRRKRLVFWAGFTAMMAGGAWPAFFDA